MNSERLLQSKIRQKNGFCHLLLELEMYIKTSRWWLVLHEEMKANWLLEALRPLMSPTLTS